MCSSCQMHVDYVFMIPIKLKITEVIKAYLKNVLSVFWSSKYILNDRVGKFTTNQIFWLAEELGFIKVYSYPNTLTGNSVIECTHSFLKAPIRKLISNHNINLDELAHVAMMAYNVFLHSSTGEAPFYLMFGGEATMPMLFKLLLPKLKYMDDGGCMREICMMTVLYLRVARDKCPPPSQEPDKAEFEVGHMVLLMNPTSTFDTKYKPSFKICKWTSDKTFDVQDSAGKVRCVSIHHLQLLNPAEHHVLMHLLDMTSF